MRPYEDYIEQFNEALKKLLKLTPTISSVDGLESEIEENEFVKAFRDLMRLRNSLSCYADFSFDDLEISEQDYEDYKSKYLDIYDKVRNDNSKNKDSILNDIDFEVELVHRDEITLYYILSLIKQLVKVDSKVFAKKRNAISNVLSGDVSLRSKKELIEKFIDEAIANLDDSEEIEEAFHSYWGEEKLKAFNELCKQENLDKEKVQSMLDEYLFSNQVVSFNQKIDDALLTRETLLKRKKTIDRVKEAILSFVEIYIEGIAA